MEEKNATVIPIGYGPAVEIETIKTLSTEEARNNTVVLSTHEDFFDEESRNKIFDNFCGAQIVYNVSFL